MTKIRDSQRGKVFNKELKYLHVKMISYFNNHAYQVIKPSRPSPKDLQRKAAMHTRRTRSDYGG